MTCISWRKLLVGISAMFLATPTPTPPGGIPSPVPQPEIIRVTATLDEPLTSLDVLQPITAANVAQITRIHTLSGHTRPILDIAFSPDGTLLMSTSGDQTVRLWDVLTGEEIASFAGPVNPDDLQIDIAGAPPQFSADGTLLAFGHYGSGDVTVWDTQTRTVRHVLSGHADYPVTLRFSPDGRLLASAGCGRWEGSDFYTCVSGEIFVWDAASGEKVAELRRNLIQTGYGSMEFSPDGRTLAYWGLEGLLLWDVQAQSSTLLPVSLNDYQFDADSRVLTTTYAGEYTLWDEGEPLARVMGIGDEVRVGFALHDGLLAYQSAEPAVRVWDTDAQAEVAVLTLPSPAQRLVFDAGGERLAAMMDYETWLWAIGSGEVSVIPYCENSPNVADGAFSPDGSLFACQMFDGIVRLWPDTARTFELIAGDPYYAYGSSAYTPDWRLWANQKDGLIAVWGVVE